MSLATDLNTLRATKPRTFEQWLEVADPADKDLVLDAIRDRTLLPNALTTALRKHGIPITRDTILAMREETP